MEFFHCNFSDGKRLEYLFEHGVGREILVESIDSLQRDPFRKCPIAVPLQTQDIVPIGTPGYKFPSQIQ